MITLDGQELQKIARDHTAELPGTDQEHRFDPDWELHKVGGKVFMLMTDMPGRPVVILKARSASPRHGTPGQPCDQHRCRSFTAPGGGGYCSRGRRPGGCVADSAGCPPLWQARRSSCRPLSVTTVAHPRHTSQLAARAMSAWGTVLG